MIQHDPSEFIEHFGDRDAIIMGLGWLSDKQVSDSVFDGVAKRFPATIVPFPVGKACEIALAPLVVWKTVDDLSKYFLVL